jgi:hypothetical protein
MVQIPVHPRVDLPSPHPTLVRLVDLLHLLVTRDRLRMALRLQADLLDRTQDPVECTLTDCE